LEVEIPLIFPSTKFMIPDPKGYQEPPSGPENILRNFLSGFHSAPAPMADEKMNTPITNKTILSFRIVFLLFVQIRFTSTTLTHLQIDK
jgi:hypothetical protein